MSNATDLDFLDDFDADEAADPTANDAPLWQRKITGFYAGTANAAQTVWKADKHFLEMSFMADVDSDADKDVIQVSFKLPNAVKPAAIFLKKCGIEVPDIKRCILKPSAKSAEKLQSLLSKCDIHIVQVPQGKYPKQIAYSPAGWDGLCAAYNGKAPTAADMGVSEGDDDGGDDVY